MGALDDLRVLDASGPIGHYAGRLLADLGADVIKVEPPGGDEARRYPPFLPDVDSPEASLPFLLLNANKRGITLDLERERGREAFLRLLSTAEVLLDSWQPAEAERLGLTEEVLFEARPDLIRTSMTGWGLSGPRANGAYADIVGAAMSGVMALAGVPDGPPDQLPDLQGYHCASIDGATGTMVAIVHRDATGQGQTVEVSMQEALSIAQETAMQGADINGVDRSRTGGAAGGGASIPGIGLYETSDGYVYMMAAGIAGSGFQGVLDAMDELGYESNLHEEPYATFIRESMNRAMLLQAMQDPARMEEVVARLQHIGDVTADFLRRHPKQVLYDVGQKHRLLIGMVSTPEDISRSPQLNARNWFIEIDDPGRGRRLRYPGFPWKLHGSPASLRRPAPLLGEHNDEILGALGIPAAQLAEPSEAEVSQ